MASHLRTMTLPPYTSKALAPHCVAMPALPSAPATSDSRSSTAQSMLSQLHLVYGIAGTASADATFGKGCVVLTAQDAWVSHSISVRQIPSIWLCFTCKTCEGTMLTYECFTGTAHVAR